MRLILLPYIKKSNLLPEKRKGIRKPGKSKKAGRRNKLKTA